MGSAKGFVKRCGKQTMLVKFHNQMMQWKKLSTGHRQSDILSLSGA
jgi:hypothetical protein